MRRSRFTDEQIVAIVHEAETHKSLDVCRLHGIPARRGDLRVTSIYGIPAGARSATLAIATPSRSCIQ